MSAIAEPPPVTQESPNVVELPESPLAFFKSQKAAPVVVATEQKKEEAKPVVTETTKLAESKSNLPPIVAATEKKKENTPEINFAALRKEKEALAAQLDELKKQHEGVTAEIEKFRTRPEPEAFEALKKEKEEIHRELKTAMVWRDPEFKRKYDDQIEAQQKQMLSIAQQAGVDQSKAVAAIRAWNVAEFDSWYADMPEFQKGQFSTAAARAQQLWQERQAEIENGEKTWEDRQKQQAVEAEKSQKSLREGFRKSVDTAYEVLVKDLPEDETLRSTVRNTMLKAVPIDADHMSAADVLKHVGASAALSHVCTQQQQELVALRAEKEEMTKKLAEQEAFIKGDAKTTPPLNGGSGQAKVEGWVNPLKLIQVKIPR